MNSLDLTTDGSAPDPTAIVTNPVTVRIRTEAPAAATLTAVDASAVTEAIRPIADPCSIATGTPISIVDMGLLRSVVMRDGAARVTLRLTHPFCFQAPLIAEAIERRVTSLGVACVVEIDPRDDWSPDLMAPGAAERLAKPPTWGAIAQVKS